MRWAWALDDDPAVVMTNGHCATYPFLGARDVLVDERQFKQIELLYQLSGTYADLAADGVTPLRLAASGPSRGDEICIPSGYWVEEPECTTTGTVYRVHEQHRYWWGSIRLPALDAASSGVRDMKYGQQTWWLTTCVGADRRFDLSVAGCKLAQPRR